MSVHNFIYLNMQWGGIRYGYVSPKDLGGVVLRKHESYNTYFCPMLNHRRFITNLNGVLRFMKTHNRILME
jgi:hypothetical protein